jgi:hypothetical protein
MHDRAFFCDHYFVSQILSQRCKTSKYFMEIHSQETKTQSSFLDFWLICLGLIRYLLKSLVDKDELRDAGPLLLVG